MDRPLKVIFCVFGIIVSIIIVASFALSFTNLNEAAIEAGVPENLAPLWPLSVDLFVLCSSLFIIRGNLVGESVTIGWIVLILFTIISIGFNVAHSPSDALSRCLHAIPPIALCVSMELFMQVIRGDIKRRFTKPIVSALGDKPVTLPAQQDENKEQVVLDYFKSNPDSTIAQCARDTGMSRNTIAKYYRGK